MYMKKTNIYTLLFTGILALGLAFTGEGSENTAESDDFENSTLLMTIAQSNL